MIHWQYTGIVPSEEQVIHHRDNNSHNNNFENLELLYKDDHGIIHTSSRGKHMVAIRCSLCGNIFYKYRNQVHKSSEHLYCSKECQFRAQRIPDNEKELYLSKKEIVKEFVAQNPIVFLNHDYKSLF